MNCHGARLLPFILAIATEANTLRGAPSGEPALIGKPGRHERVPKRVQSSLPRRIARAQAATKSESGRWSGIARRPLPGIFRFAAIR